MDNLLTILENDTGQKPWQHSSPPPTPPASNKIPYRYAIQDDGELVVYNKKKEKVWETDLNIPPLQKNGPYKLVLSDQGILQIKDNGGIDIWTSERGKLIVTSSTQDITPNNTYVSAFGYQTKTSADANYINIYSGDTPAQRKLKIESSNFQKTGAKNEFKNNIVATNLGNTGMIILHPNAGLTFRIKITGTLKKKYKFTLKFFAPGHNTNRVNMRISGQVDDNQDNVAIEIDNNDGITEHEWNIGNKQLNPGTYTLTIEGHESIGLIGIKLQAA